MALIKEKDVKPVQERLAKLAGTVTLAVFTQEFECEMCRTTRELAEEVAALSGGKVKVEVYDLVRDKAKADSLRVEKIPAIAVLFVTLAAATNRKRHGDAPNAGRGRHASL